MYMKATESYCISHLDEFDRDYGARKIPIGFIEKL